MKRRTARVGDGEFVHTKQTLALHIHPLFIFTPLHAFIPIPKDLSLQPSVIHILDLCTRHPVQGEGNLIIAQHEHPLTISIARSKLRCRMAKDEMRPKHAFPSILSFPQLNSPPQKPRSSLPSNSIIHLKSPQQEMLLTIQYLLTPLLIIAKIIHHLFLRRLFFRRTLALFARWSRLD